MPDQPEFDSIILDVGGDEIVVLSGDMATPAGVTATVERFRAQRLERLLSAPDDRKELHARWMRGESLYLRRTVNLPGEGELQIFAYCPGLGEHLEREKALGADEEELAEQVRVFESGLIHGVFSSRVEPGEPAQLHVCDFDAELTEGEFLTARMQGWRFP
jgi:hypothetical protein